jgi:kynureninase
MCDYVIRYDLIRMSFHGLYISFDDVKKASDLIKTVFETSRRSLTSSQSDLIAKL